MVRVKTNTKYMIKIITTSLVMVLMSVFMAVGIWASPSEPSTISSVISFLATDVDVSLVGVVSGSEVPVETFQTNISNEEYDEVSKSWNLGRLMFNNSTKAPITMGIAIRNNSEETKPYIQTNVFGNVPSNIRVKYSQIGGENANPYSQTVSKNDFSSAIISSLQSECFETSTNGLSVPEYNPLVINNLTQGKVYYYQVEFSIIDKSREVESFCLDLGITLKSKKTDSIYQIESKKDSSSPSEGGNCGYEVIENSENESRIKFVAEVEEGYEFDGWYVKDNSNNVSDRVSSDPVFITSTTADVTYYAKWKIARKVSFVVDGINKGEATYSSGTVSDFASAYEPSPYSTGWFLNEELTKVAKDDFLSTDTETSPITLYCRTASITGLTFTLSSDGNSYLVAGESSTSPSGEVVLPNKYDGKPVSGFVKGSSSSPTFKKNTNITSVVLSNNIVQIADYTFSYSTKITNVTIPDSVISIGVYAFDSCSGLTSIEIPNSVTSIEAYAFNGCSGLTSIEIPNSVKNVDTGIFENCIELVSVQIGLGMSVLTDFMFLSCEKLMNIVIPINITKLGIGVFDSCSGLTSIEIPSSVTSIGNRAFYGCSGLTSIVVASGNTKYDSRNNCNAIIETASNTLIVGCKNTIIPNTVTSIGNSAFGGCSGLTSIEIPNSVTTIGESAFYGCTGLTKIFIPKSVTTISASSVYRSVFYDCSSNLVIYCEASSKPDGWGTYWNYRTDSAIHTTYWGKTYEDCYPTEYSVSVGKYSLSPNAGCSYSVSPSTILSTGTEVTYKAVVSDGYRFMGWYDSSSGGELVSNNETYVTTLYEPTTYYAYWVRSVSVSFVVDGVNKGTKNYTSGTVSNFASTYEPSPYFTGWFLNEDLTKVAKDDYLSKYTSTSPVTLYCKTASITGLVFTLTDDGNSYLISTEKSSPSGEVILPNMYNGKPIIGFYAGTGSDVAFKSKTITSVVISNNITTISNYAFGFSSKLETVKIPNSVTSIGEYAFYNCSALTAIEIPSSVTKIATPIVGHMSKFTSIVVDSGNTVYDSRNNCNAIIETATNTLIQGCGSSVIPNTVVSIGDYAFYWCINLTSIDIPDSVTAIGKQAFYVCYSLTGAFKLPSNLISIGDYAFDNCYNLTGSLTIPKSVKSIGIAPFTSCKGLTSIVVESGNTVYDSRNSCNAIIETATNRLIQGFKSTVMPSTVVIIGTSAFENCTGLTGTLSIPSNVTSIEDRAFYGCSGLTGTLTIPTKVTTIGDSAFSSCSGLTGTLTIPNSVTSIGSSAFRECEKLTSVEISNNITILEVDIFYNCKKLTSIIIPSSVTTIKPSAFANCSGLTKIFIPKSVTTISGSSYYNSPFYQCSSTLEIYCEAPSKPDGWGDYWNYSRNSTILTTYWGASSTDVTGTLDKLTFTLTSDGNNYSVKAKNTSISGKVVIPDYYNGKPVTEIASSAFSSCGSLTEIIIPDSITTIGSFAFELCTGMKKIFIPKSVTTIVASAASYLPFNRCSTILTIYCEVSSKPSGWGRYWNNRTNSAKFTPQWGYTREQYNAV